MGSGPLLETSKLESVSQSHDDRISELDSEPYYIRDLQTNYNYPLIWGDWPTDPGITRQFQLIFSQGKAHLWKRFHELGDGSPLELCVPCGDPQPAS